MRKPRILVTSAAGRTGFSVRAFVRRDDPRALKMNIPGIPVTSATGRTGRVIGFTSIAFLVAIAAGVALLSWNAVPLPGNIEMGTPTAQDVREGRALLNTMRGAHGGESRWREFQRADVVVTHDIVFAPYRWLLGEYGHNPQRMKWSSLLGTENARLVFLDGPDQGLQWGVQNWATFKIEPNKEPVFEQDSGVSFYVPTGLYFLTVAFRIQEASSVALIGEKEWEGRTYDIVMATWDGFEPKAALDQYVLWIDRETRRLDYMTFTVRDQGGFIVATISYLDYREVAGILFPFEARIVRGDEPDDSPELHHFKVGSVELSRTAEQEFFFPRPELSFPKPTG